jgi:catechol 2,3-dioxygenase
MTTLPYGLQPTGYRLPDATRLGRVRLQVTDLARSQAYYTDVLGLRVIAQRDGVIEFGPHDDDRVIVELRAGATQPVPRGGRQGLFHFAILLPDRASLGRFFVHLSDIGAHAGSSDHLVSEAIYLHDPDGLGIEVYADRPRETWQHAARELTMATVPLDVRSVVAAANGETWTGMPAGTVLGHVHLHVASLDDARGFYHEGLGMDLVVWSYPGALFFSAGGYHHHLGTNTWAAAQPSAGADEARLLNWDVLLPDAASVAAAKASVLTRGGAVADVDGGFEARDPWGTVVRVASH